MPSVLIEAEPRNPEGSNEARRQRREGKIPAVLYGAKKKSIPVALSPKQVLPLLHSEYGHNRILQVKVKGGETTSAVIQDWLFEPVYGKLLHVDLRRIALHEKLRVKVPVMAVGEAKGVKVQGGILEFVLREVEVECLPADIPDHIQADVTELVIGKNLRVRDLVVGPKARIVSPPDHVVAHIVVLKEEKEEKPPEEVAAAPAEPEVIRRGKAEKAEGEAEGEVQEEGKEGKKKHQEEGKKK